MVDIKKTVETGKKFFAASPLGTQFSYIKSAFDKLTQKQEQKQEAKKQSTLQEARQVFQERVSGVEPSPKQQFQRLVESSGQKESSVQKEISSIPKSSFGVSGTFVQKPAEDVQDKIQDDGVQSKVQDAKTQAAKLQSAKPVVVSGSIPKQSFEQAFQPSFQTNAPLFQIQSTFSSFAKTSTSVPPADIKKEEEKFFKKQFEDVVQEAHKREQVERGRNIWQDRISGVQVSPQKEFEEYSKTFQVKAPKVDVDEFSETPKATFSKYSPYNVKSETVTFTPSRMVVDGKEYFAFDAKNYNVADLTWYAKKIGYDGKIYSFEDKYLFDVSDAPVLTTKRAVVDDFLLGAIDGTPIKSDEGIYVYDVEEKSGYFFSVPKENYDALLNALLESGKVSPKYSSTYGNNILDKLKEKGEAVVRFVSRQPAGFETSKDFKIVDAGDSLYVYTSDPNFRQYLNVAESGKMQQQMIRYQAERLYASEGELDRFLRSNIKTLAPVQVIKAGILSGEQGISFEQALSEVGKQEALKGYEDYLKWAMGSKNVGSTASFLWKQSGVRVPLEFGSSWSLGSVLGVFSLGEKVSGGARLLPLVAGTGLAFSWTPSVVQSIKGEKPWSETSQVISESVFDIEAMRSGFSSGFNVGSKIRFLLDERKLQPVIILGKGKAFVGAKVPISRKDLGPASLGRAREGSVELLYKVTPSGEVIVDYPGRSMLLAPVTKYGVSVYPFSYGKLPLERFKSDIDYIVRGVKEPWKNIYMLGVDMTLKRTPGIKGEGQVSFRKSEMLDVRKVLKDDVFFKEFSRGWTRTGVTEAGYKYSLKPEKLKNLEEILFVSGAGVKEYLFGKVGVFDEPIQNPATWRMIENIQKSRVLNRMSSNLKMRAGEWRVNDKLFQSLYKKYPEYFYRESEGVFPYTRARQFMVESGGKPVVESYIVSQRFVEVEPSPFFKVSNVQRPSKSFSQLVDEIYGKGFKAGAESSVFKAGAESSVETGSSAAKVSLKPFVSSMPVEGAVLQEYSVAFPAITLDSNRILPASELQSSVQPFSSTYIKPLSSTSLDVLPESKLDAKLQPLTDVFLEPAFESKVQPLSSILPASELQSSVQPISITSLDVLPESRLDARLQPLTDVFLEPVFEPVKVETPFGAFGVPPASSGSSKGERKKRKKQEEYAAFSKEPKLPETYLFPDLYSVMVSQAAFGKATIPEFAPSEKVKLYEKGLIRVPTKEYKGIGSSKEMWKKILGFEGD